MTWAWITGQNVPLRGVNPNLKICTISLIPAQNDFVAKPYSFLASAKSTAPSTMTQIKKNPFATRLVMVYAGPRIYSQVATNSTLLFR